MGWIAAWLAISLLAVSAGGFFRRHYFLLAVPPLSLLAGLGLAGVVGRIASARASRVLTALGAVLVIGYAVLQSPWYYAGSDANATLARIYGSNPFPEAVHVGRWLRERSDPADTIFVYGSEPELFVYAERRSASRYIYVYPLTMPAGNPGARQEEVLAALRSDPPRYVVACFVDSSLLDQPGTPPELRSGLRELIDRDYEVAGVVPFTRDRSARIVEGTAARTLWRERPLWDGGAPWAAFVIWERRPTPGAPRESGPLFHGE